MPCRGCAHPRERVRAGQPLMDGPSNPHDILNVLGEKALAGVLGLSVRVEHDDHVRTALEREANADAQCGTLTAVDGGASRRGRGGYIRRRVRRAIINDDA